MICGWVYRSYTIRFCCGFIAQQVHNKSNKWSVRTSIQHARKISSYIRTHDATLGRLCQNATSSTKPEVHNVSQRRQKKTEPRAQARCKIIGEAVPREFLRYNRVQAIDPYPQIRDGHHNTLHISRGGGEVITWPACCRSLTFGRRDVENLSSCL